MSASARSRTTPVPIPDVSGEPYFSPECSYFHLRRVMRLAGRLYDTEIADSGLKTTQYSLLSAIRTLGPIAPGALARRLSLDASTLTRNLRPMLDAGWVTLAAGADGRTRQVAITPEGIARRRTAAAAWKRAQKRFGDLLGDVRVAELHRVLDECRSVLEAGDDASSDDSTGGSAARSMEISR